MLCRETPRHASCVSNRASLPIRVTRYTSLAGISLFRRHLHEIPELGITLASVHPDPDASMTVKLRAESTCHMRDCQDSTRPLITCLMFITVDQEEPATLSFEQLYRVATRMRTMDTVNKAFRRQVNPARSLSYPPITQPYPPGDEMTGATCRGGAQEGGALPAEACPSL